MMNPYKKTWLDYLDPDKSTMKKRVRIYSLLTYPTVGWSQGADAMAESIDECMEPVNPSKYFGSLEYIFEI